jgi:hypothetical protein
MADLIEQLKALYPLEMALSDHPLAQLVARLRELETDRPGTPLGRLKALTEFAKGKGWCSGMPLQPIELIVMAQVNNALNMIRELGIEFESCRAQLQAKTLNCQNIESDLNKTVRQRDAAEARVQGLEDDLEKIVEGLQEWTERIVKRRSTSRASGIEPVLRKSA